MDIITRLLLKTNDFDANLNKAKGSVNDFQGGVSSMAQTAGAGVMKFAGAIGLAAGAYETFDKLIHSSQSTQDAFEWRMGACRETVDAFFHSLSSGDFSAFNQGISETYNNMIRLQQLRDDFADAKVSNNVFRAQYAYESQRLKAVVSSNTSTKEEKQKAAAELRKITDSFSKQISSTNEINVAQMVQNAQAKTGRYFSKEDVIRFFKVYNNPASLDDRKPAFDDYTAKLNDLKKKEFHRETRTTGYGMNARTVSYKVADPEVQNQIQQLRKENNELDRMYSLAQHNDKTWEELSSSVIEYYSAQEEAARNLNFLVKQENKVDKTSGKNDTPPPVGSIGNIDSELSKLNKKLTEATTMEARAAVQATINELEQRKVNLKIVVDQEAFKIKHGEMKGGELAAPGSIYEALQNNAGNKKGSSFELRKELPNMKLPKFKSPIKKDDINLNNEYAESLSGIGSIMGSLSGVFDGSSASVLQWGASLIGTIGQAIPAILAMIPAKAADTEATNANTTANVANAGSKVLSAHAGIPFAGIALGIAGIASIAAAMASLPAFENGGIVPGTSFSGDKVLARVNSGEAILNQGQQSNLFRLLNGGVSFPDRVNVAPQIANLSRLIAPSEGNQRIELAGSVRVGAKDLELVLKNRNKIMGRIK